MTGANGVAKPRTLPAQPQSAEAGAEHLFEVSSELLLAGTLARNPPIIEQIAGTGLQPRDFQDYEVRAFYEICLDRYKKKLDTDLPILLRELRRNRVFAGSANVRAVDDFITKAHDAVVSSIHWKFHSEGVLEAARRRRMIRLADTMRNDILSGSPSDSIAADVRCELEEIERAFSVDALLAHLHPATERLSNGEPERYLIPGVVPASQFGVFSARTKSLKTKSACDLVVSAATGRPFLNYWEVPDPVRVGMISREVRGNTLDSWIDDIAAAKGCCRADLGNLIVDDQLTPDLTDPRCLTMLRRMIERFDLECLVLDPINRMLPGVNMNDMGEMTQALDPVERLTQDTGAAILIVHHNRKNVRDIKLNNAPPTLEDITGSGVANVVRFWILLNRRKDWDSVTRRHWLWLVLGGSSGHSATKHYLAEEGRSDAPGGTYWHTEICDPEVGDGHDTQEEEERTAAKDAAKLAKEREAVCKALAAHPAGLSWSKAMKLAKVSQRRWDIVKEAMLEEGDVEDCDVQVGNQKSFRPGIKLAATELS